jgi:hypothetical protein
VRKRPGQSLAETTATIRQKLDGDLIAMETGKLDLRLRVRYRGETYCAKPFLAPSCRNGGRGTLSEFG